jgi:glutamate racemase
VGGGAPPGAVPAVPNPPHGRVGYMATDATVASGAYERAIAAADPFVTVTAVACPELVPLIERGSPFDAAIVDAVRHYTQPLREAEVDTVILGCTHYPLIRPLLQRMLGRGVEIVSSGEPVARQVEHVLGSRGLGNPRSGEGDYRFLTSADPEGLRASGTRFLQLPIGSVETVPLNAAELSGDAAGRTAAASDGAPRHDGAANDAPRVTDPTFAQARR